MILYPGRVCEVSCLMKEKAELLARLRKVEGQVRGIQKMIEDERECSDVIRQVVAASRALDSVGFMITSKSLKDCIKRSIVSGDDSVEVMDDVIKMVFAAAKSGV
jgi:CsoR family transcriptional regulator, copper-sensing transcriptional repressor